MYAFYKTNLDGTIRIYDKTEDWHVQSGKIERWFSQWSFDRYASLEAALERFLDDHFDETFSKEQLVICQKT